MLRSQLPTNAGRTLSITRNHLVTPCFPRRWCIPAALENHSSDSITFPPYREISDPCQRCSRAVTAKRVIKMALNQPARQITLVGSGVSRETVAWARELMGSNGFEHSVSTYRGTY